MSHLKSSQLPTIKSAARRCCCPVPSQRPSQIRSTFAGLTPASAAMIVRQPQGLDRRRDVKRQLSDLADRVPATATFLTSPSLARPSAVKRCHNRPGPHGRCEVISDVTVDSLPSFRRVRTSNPFWVDP